MSYDILGVAFRLTLAGEIVHVQFSPFLYLKASESIARFDACIFAFHSNETVVVLPQNCNGESYAIGAGVFENNTALTSIEIPNGVTSIGEEAFSGCSGLASVTFGDGVTSIGKKAFYGCSALTNVEIPNSVTSIGDYAFYGCSGLASITIGSGITSIGVSALEYCDKLEKIYLASMVPPCVDSWSLVVDYGNVILYIPRGTLSIYQATDGSYYFVDIREYDVVGINDVKEQTTESNVVYDIGGRVVENPTKGIYIINGEKVLIK